jgi:hypothetical protein
MTLLLILLVSFSIVFELCAFWVYGPILNSKIVDEALDYHAPKGVHLNSYSSDILILGDMTGFGGNEMPYISKLPVSILSKYYISNVGRVSRFSNAHKRITELYKQAETPIPTKTIKQKLNIK